MPCPGRSRPNSPAAWPRRDKTGRSGLGLAPVIISLTTLDLMPPRGAARYYLTGETFDAATAAELGLITTAASSASVDDVIAGLTGQIRETSPPGALAPASSAVCGTTRDDPSGRCTVWVTSAAGTRAGQ